MLQRLIYSAKVNVFESARFYYFVLNILFLHLIFRYSLLKYLKVVGEEEYISSKLIYAALYGFSYACCLLTTFFLKTKFSKLFFKTWIIIVSVSIFNEIEHIISDENYSLIKSFSSGQGFVNFKITHSLLFIAVWKTLNNTNQYSLKFMALFEKFVILNSLCVFMGWGFDINFFQSYPATTRWGYSGFLTNVYSVIFSSICLIGASKKEKLNWIKILAFSAPLVIGGTKAGLLSFFLIVLIVYIRSKHVKMIFGVVSILLLSLSNLWVHLFINLFPFWKSVYEKYGIWGLLSSLRSENLKEFLIILKNNNDYFKLLTGGIVRIESLWIEILPFDIFVFFGFLGVCTFTYLFIKWIPTWGKAIPLLTAIGSGSILVGSLSFIVWAIWIESSNYKIKS